MSAVVPYVAPALGALLLAAVLWCKKEPPGVAYLAFTIFGATLAFMVMVETNWIAKVPAFVWGGRRYGLAITKLQESVVAYETETFDAKNPAVKVVELPASARIRPDEAMYSVSITLKHSAVPESVLLWEGNTLLTPTRYTVEDNVVTISRTVWDPHRFVDEDLMVPIGYVVRYHRSPEFDPTEFSSEDFDTGTTQQPSPTK